MVDPGEIRDLSQSESQRFAEMIRDYDDYCKKYGVLEMGINYEPLLEIQDKLLTQIGRAARPWLLVLAASLILLLIYKKFK